MLSIDDNPLGAGDAQWYAIQTRSNFEKIVDGEMRSKGIESYLPVLRGMHQWKDRRKLIEQPLFPGYVFSSFVDGHAARLRVLRTSGVVRILGSGTSIEPIPETEIAGVRRLLTSGMGAFVHPFLREGDWVRVKRGPLENVEGVLERFKSQARLVLSIDLLCRSVATEIDASDVEPLLQSRNLCTGLPRPNFYQPVTTGGSQRCIQI